MAHVLRQNFRASACGFDNRVIYILSAIGLFLLSFLFVFTFKNGRKIENVSGSRQKEAVKCPLCGGSLTGGAVLYSTIYGKKSLKVREAFIRGCTNCAAKESTRERRCPVCGAALSREECVAARVFAASMTKKMHVIVNGCPKCRKT